ncbi:MAG: hypothetical protein AAGD05_18380, partial [Bacteroidota bacterium]
QHIQNKMKAYGLGWADVEVSNAIDYKGQPQPAALMIWKNRSQKAFPEWTQKRPGTVEPIRGKRYRLHVYAADSSQHFTAELEWVMPLKSLFSFPPETWRNNYQNNLAQIEAERQRVDQMAEVYRSFELANFGIYNWDRIMKQQERIELLADFEVDVSINQQLTKLEFYYISGDNKSLIRLQNHYERPIGLLPDPGARIFSILPGKRLALFSAAEYAAIDLATLAQATDQRHVFTLKKQNAPLDDAAIFKQLLGI